MERPCIAILTITTWITMPVWRKALRKMRIMMKMMWLIAGLIEMWGYRGVLSILYIIIIFFSQCVSFLAKGRNEGLWECRDDADMLHTIKRPIFQLFNCSIVFLNYLLSRRAIMRVSRGGSTRVTVRPRGCSMYMCEV